MPFQTIKNLSGGKRSNLRINDVSDDYAKQLLIGVTRDPDKRLQDMRDNPYGIVGTYKIDTWLRFVPEGEK